MHQSPVCFLNNKYTTYYYKIIDNAKQRNTTGYCEQHHIIPKALHGSNDESNLVRLTAREHFICHLLLTRMTTGIYKYKMIYAAWTLANTSGVKINSKVYSYVKEQRAALQRSTTGRTLSLETRQKMSIARKGKKLTEETKRRMRKPKSVEHINNIRISKIGTHLSEETRKSISAKRKLHYIEHGVSEETRKNISLATTGRHLSEEQKEKMRQSRLGKHLSDRTKSKISDSKKGKKQSPETILKSSKSRTGLKRSPETKLKMSQSMKGRSKAPAAIITNSLTKLYTGTYKRAEFDIAELQIVLNNPNLPAHLREIGVRYLTGEFRK